MRKDEKLRHLFTYSPVHLFLDVLHPPDFSALQPDFDAARMYGLARQDVFHDALDTPARLLILFLHDDDREAGLDVFAHGAVHRMNGWYNKTERRPNPAVFASLLSDIYTHTCLTAVRSI
jgi:hypothetical protein